MHLLQNELRIRQQSDQTRISYPKKSRLGESPEAASIKTYRAYYERNS